jgi:hypothetical protein
MKEKPKDIDRVRAIVSEMTEWKPELEALRERVDRLEQEHRQERELLIALVQRQSAQLRELSTHLDAHAKALDGLTKLLRVSPELESLLQRYVASSTVLLARHSRSLGP